MYIPKDKHHPVVPSVKYRIFRRWMKYTKIKEARCSTLQCFTAGSWKVVHKNNLPKVLKIGCFVDIRIINILSGFVSVLSGYNFSLDVTIHRNIYKRFFRREVMIRPE